MPVEPVDFFNQIKGYSVEGVVRVIRDIMFYEDEDFFEREEMKEWFSAFCYENASEILDLTTALNREFREMKLYK